MSVHKGDRVLFRRPTHVADSATQEWPEDEGRGGGPRSRLSAAAALIAATALAASGCSLIAGGQGSGKKPSASPTASASSLEGTTSSAYGTEGMAPIGKLSPTIQSSAMGIDADTAQDKRWGKFYDQEISWEKCDDPKYSKAQCATVEVPLKWNEPDGKTISLLITKLEASGEKKGSLLMNPGGPGGSGNQSVAQYGSETTTEKLRQNYDLIGFDPRGVKDSAGIECLDDKGTDEYVSTTFSDTEAGSKDAEGAWKKVTKACKENSGDLLQDLDTYSAARDMDVIRQAVGSKKLDYLGYSYGTYLGATYAELYPKRTGKMVLDGAVDPSLTADEVAAGQAAGFEESVTSFVKWCQEGGTQKCPLKGSVEDGKKQIRDFLAEANKNPVKTSSDRELTGALALTGVLTPMYGNENWEFLAMALDQAFQGNGDLLLMFADLANERNSDGTFESNGSYAISAVNCLDRQGVVDEKWVEKESERLAKKYPTFGKDLGGSGTMCQQWPAKGVRTPAPIHAKGSSPIVVVGTTGDPATPYAWSESLNEQLDNSVLLTYEGNGHTAYGRSGGCIEEAVDAYFVEGTVPKDGLRCKPAQS